MVKIKTRSILKNKRFRALRFIGGHRVYHLEGNALKHSLLVWEVSKTLFKGNPFMQKVALLHDVGKTRTSVRNGSGDWSYPNHSAEGGKILGKFIPESHPRFNEAQWFVMNHIKPLFWKSKEDAEKLLPSAPRGWKSIQDLAVLALCDIYGSHSTEEATTKNLPLIKLLTEISGR